MKIKSFIAFFFLIIVSIAFAALAIVMYFSIKDIHLDERNKKTGAITFCKKATKKEKMFNSRGFSIPINIDTYALQLDNEDFYYSIHEPSQDYSKYQDNLSLGDTVTVFYNFLT